MGKTISKNKNKKLSSKYGQKVLYHAKQSVTDAFTTTPSK